MLEFHYSQRLYIIICGRETGHTAEDRRTGIITHIPHSNEEASSGRQSWTPTTTCHDHVWLRQGRLIAQEVWPKRVGGTGLPTDGSLLLKESTTNIAMCRETQRLSFHFPPLPRRPFFSGPLNHLSHSSSALSRFRPFVPE